MKKYIRGATAPELHLETFRHTCALDILRVATGLIEVTAVFGHTKLDTTVGYARLGLGDRERALERRGRSGSSSSPLRIPA